MKGVYLEILRYKACVTKLGLETESLKLKLRARTSYLNACQMTLCTRKPKKKTCLQNRSIIPNIHQALLLTINDNYNLSHLLSMNLTGADRELWITWASPLGAFEITLTQSESLKRKTFFPWVKKILLLPKKENLMKCFLHNILWHEIH